MLFYFCKECLGLLALPPQEVFVALPDKGWKDDTFRQARRAEPVFTDFLSYAAAISVFVKNVLSIRFTWVDLHIVFTPGGFMALRTKSVSAMKKLLAKREAWNPYSGLPSLADAEQERRTRIAILERGNSRADAQLAKRLRE